MEVLEKHQKCIPTIKLFRTSPTVPTANTNALKCKTQAYKIQCETKHKYKLSKPLNKLFKQHTKNARCLYSI